MSIMKKDHQRQTMSVTKLSHCCWNQELSCWNLNTNQQRCSGKDVPPPDKTCRKERQEGVEGLKGQFPTQFSVGQTYCDWESAGLAQSSFICLQSISQVDSHSVPADSDHRGAQKPAANAAQLETASVSAPASASVPYATKRQHHCASSFHLDATPSISSRSYETRVCLSVCRQFLRCATCELSCPAKSHLDL